MFWFWTGLMAIAIWGVVSNEIAWHRLLKIMDRAKVDNFEPEINRLRDLHKFDEARALLNEVEAVWKELKAVRFFKLSMYHFLLPFGDWRKLYGPATHKLMGWK